MSTTEYEVVPEASVRRRRPRVPAGPRYIARKPMTLGERKIRIGDVVPEAAGWPRVESWVRSGYIEIVEG